MASQEKLEKLLAKADKAAEQAVGSVNLIQGPARAPLHAQLAQMWLAVARLEFQQLHAERQDRQITALKSRVAALEAKMGVEPAFPDPFANRKFDDEGLEQPEAGF